MITGRELEEEAKVFLIRFGQRLEMNSYAGCVSIALEYIKRYSEGKFRYKDDVEAGALVDALISSNYLELIVLKDKPSIIKITKEGRVFLNK